MDFWLDVQTQRFPPFMWKRELGHTWSNIVMEFHIPQIHPLIQACFVPQTCVGSWHTGFSPHGWQIP